MKFKVKNILLVSFLAIAGFFGVSSTLIDKQVNDQPVVEKAEATRTYQGSIAIEFQNSNGGWYWDNDNAKVAIYVHSGASGDLGWTSMISTIKDTHRYEIPYSFDSSPMGSKIDLVRYPSNHSDTPDWNNENWGRINGKSFGSVIYAWGNDANVQVTEYPFIGSNSLGWERSETNILTFAHFDGSVAQVYGPITFSQGDYFKYFYTNGGTAYNGLKSGIDSTYIEGSPYHPYNINCYYYGTYTVYFEHAGGSNNMWITIPDRAKAEHWGKTFLDTITCTGTSPGAVTSATTAWTTTMSGAYTALSTDQQGEIWKIAANAGGTYLEQAVYRYDFIIHKYGTSTYTDFIGRKNTGGGYAMGAIHDFSPFKLISDDENNISTIIIIAASSVALLSVTALSILVIKKRKNKE